MYKVITFIFLLLFFQKNLIAQSNKITDAGRVDPMVMALLPLDTLLLGHNPNINEYAKKIEKVVDAYAVEKVDKESCMKFIRAGMKNNQKRNYYITARQYIENDFIERYALSDVEIKGLILEYTFRFALWKAFNCELGIKLVGENIISIPPINLPTVIPKITMPSYLVLEKNITYAKAVQILGSPGKELSRINIGEYETVVYMWKNSSNGTLNITFQNNKLIGKMQFGL